MKPVYLIYGNDDFTAIKTAATWRRAFAQKYSDAAIIAIETDGESTEFCKQLQSATGNQSLFTTVSLIIVNDVFNLTDEKAEELLLKIVNEAAADTYYLLLRHRGLPDKRRRLYKQLSALAKNKEIELRELMDPSIPERARWVKKYCQRHNVAIGEEALGLLLERCANLPYWLLVQQVELLVTVVDGEIDVPNVLLYVPAQSGTDNFGITDALAARNVPLALKRALPLLLARNPKPDELISSYGSIAWVVRTLLLVKEGSDTANIHPNVLRKLRPLVNNWQLSELRELLIKIGELDFEVKNGRNNHVSAIENIILSAK